MKHGPQTPTWASGASEGLCKSPLHANSNAALLHLQSRTWLPLLLLLSIPTAVLDSPLPQTHPPLSIQLPELPMQVPAAGSGCTCTIVRMSIVQDEWCRCMRMYSSCVACHLDTRSGTFEHGDVRHACIENTNNLALQSFQSFMYLLTPLLATCIGMHAADLPWCKHVNHPGLAIQDQLIKVGIRQLYDCAQLGLCNWLT